MVSWSCLYVFMYSIARMFLCKRNGPLHSGKHLQSKLKKVEELPPNLHGTGLAEMKLIESRAFISLVHSCVPYSVLNGSTELSRHLAK